MGNCLKASTLDDISLLRGNDSTNGPISGTQSMYHKNGLNGWQIAPQCCKNPDLALYMKQTDSWSVIFLRSGQSEHYQRELYPSTSASTTRTPSSNNRQLSDENQVKIAKRIGLMQYLPIGTYDGSSKKERECVICMAEFCVNEAVRYLPCMHIYHVNCIDDWLLRSLTCPSCLEPVDAALLTSYDSA